MTNKIYICTYFDYNFLPRGLALFYSVKHFHTEFEFYVLTFDNETYNHLLMLNEENLKLISLTDYETYFETSADKFDDKKQYYFSATPNVCLYLLNKNPHIDILLYLDADVYVYNSLKPLYDEFGISSIGFCSHRFHPIFRFLSRNYGKFNVGVNLFRNSEEGLKCLNDWKNDCDSWYPNKPDYPLKIFSDQIFLDSWENKFSEIKIIDNVGIDTAPWNVANYSIRKAFDSYYIDNVPLIIFHFSSLIKENDIVWNSNSIIYLASIKNNLLDIYTEYIRKIEAFGINNKKSEKINHKNSFLKKIFHTLMKVILNEKISVN